MVDMDCDHGTFCNCLIQNGPKSFFTRMDFKKKNIIELDDGKIYRKPLYLMVKTMVSG